ncbi:glycoside hydrolase family 3 C-terminal domain-containing protein, partial [Desulfosarcina sp.]|uniref:glycoside hydrolase family 3 C-terminal domain-containing protein n=1 Tax=Desulfosarcina sp. TaxID=2027861 RepID=UPI003970ED10
QEGGNAIAKVLFGEVNPSGKLPETLPVKLSDNPAFGNYPGENNEVHYNEGIFVGYRHYDSNNIEPLFPFGHGLSYTSFEYSDLEITETNNSFVATMHIQNTGNVAGAEVGRYPSARPAFWPSAHLLSATCPDGGCPGPFARWPAG